ncbi:MAG TPA: hypothetical protein VGG72_29325 [Bryobacteraceae bacterium]
MRELTQLAVDKGALALTIVLGGAVVLLLAGTQILDWYWLVLLAAVSLGVGAYRLRKSLSSRYILAQRIDRRLELADALSTALYFSENPRPDRAAVCERQHSQAEAVAAQVDVKHALPFRRSRYLAPAALLFVVAFGLFGLRYLVLGTLDLKASLIGAVYDNFFSTKPNEARNQLPKRANFDPKMGDSNQDMSIQADRQPEDLLDSQNATDPADSPSDNSKDASKEGTQKDGESSSADKGKQDESGKGKESPDQDSKDAKEGSDNKGNPNDAKQNSNSASGQKNESMLDKMKNALSDLANKVKQAAEGSKGDQAPKGSPDKQDQDQKGDQGKDAQTQPQSNGQMNGQQGQEQQPSDSKNDQKASQQSKGPDGKSGIGAQDGEKAIKQAEQLQAMGKISEIIGKRSAAVSGEMMVEVGNGKQQLKTPWQQQQASHTNAGGEIHRDEIPLTEQPFVEKYFEEIRKAAPAPVGKKDG